MKKSKVFTLFLTLALTASVLAGCGQRNGSGSEEKSAQDNGTTQESDAVQGSDASQAEAPENLSIKNAEYFDIEYMAGNVKLVTDSDGRKLLLVPEGVEAPAGYEDAVQVTTPISNVMYTSTVQVGCLGGLEEESLYDSISAVCTPEEDWTVPQVLERFQNGQITYIAHDQSNVGDMEEITALDPQFVFVSGGQETGVKLASMLDEVGIDYAVDSSWMETENAASLEWIKFYAAFFNLDEKADKIYEEKLARLEELYEKAAAIPEEERPTMAYGLVYDGVVYTQAGNSTFAKQMEKAGAVYALKDLEGEGSVQIGMEEFLDKCKDADILIYGSLPQYCADKEALLAAEPLFAEFKAFQNDQIYIFDKGYYMNSDKVVEKFEDAVAIYHPDLIPEHTLTMYQKLS